MDLASRSLTAVVALLAFAVPVSAARADAISLTTGPDPTEDVPLTVTATWSSTDPAARAFVTVKPGPACPARLDGPAVLASPAAATGSASAEATLEEPGSYTLCGYLQDDAGDTSALAMSAPLGIAVRPPRATVGIWAQPSVVAGERFTVSFPVSAEVPRQLWATVKPAGGRCEASFLLDLPVADSLVPGTDVRGRQTVSAISTAPRVPGSYQLCAYVQERFLDIAAEAAATGGFAVAPDACMSARAVLPAAVQALQSADAAVTRFRRAYRREATRPRLAARDRRRHATAVRRRTAARSALARAQAGVTASCR